MISNNAAKSITSVAIPLSRPPLYFLDDVAREALRQTGWVMLEGIPPSEAQVESLLTPLGTLMPQYGRKKFWAVKSIDQGKGTSLGDRELGLHTELAEFSEPPEYVALYAEKPAQTGGALRLCDVRAFLASLSKEELTLLLTESLTVKAEDPIASRYGEYSYTGPILDISPRGITLRLDQYFINLNGSQAIRNFRDRLVEFSKDKTVEIKQEKGSLVIWDNRFVVHGRSAFEGQERCLWRCCIKATPDSLK